MMDLTPETVELLKLSITGLAIVFLGMVTLNAISHAVVKMFSED